MSSKGPSSPDGISLMQLKPQLGATPPITPKMDNENKDPNYIYTSQHKITKGIVFSEFIDTN